MNRRKRERHHFSVLIELICEDDRESVKTNMCSGALEVLERELKSENPSFWFCLSFCNYRKVRFVGVIHSG